MLQRPPRPELTLPRFLAVNALLSVGFGLAVGWSSGSIADGLVGFASAFAAFQIVWLALLVRTARADGRDAVRGPEVLGARDRRGRTAALNAGQPLRRGSSKP